MHSKAANTAKWSANNELKVEDCVWQLSLKSPFNCRMALSIPDFDSADSSYSKCSMYDVNYTEVMSSGIKKADPSWPIKACQHGWEFNFTEVPYSTVATDVRIYSNVTRKWMASLYCSLSIFTARMGVWSFLSPHIVPIDFLLGRNCWRTIVWLDCRSFWSYPCFGRLQPYRIRGWRRNSIRHQLLDFQLVPFLGRLRFR